MEIKSVIGLDKVDLPCTESCLMCIQGTMQKTAMRARTAFEQPPSVVLHNDDTEMSVVSFGRTAIL